MPSPLRRSHGRFLLALTAALLLGACAPSFVPGGVPTPREIPALESRLVDQPGDRDNRIRLGAAYVEAQRPEEALRVLQPVTGDGPELVGLLVSGGALEALGRYDEARAAYERVLRLSDPSQTELRRTAEDRIPLVRRRQLEVDVRAAVAREAELMQRTPSDEAVAVFPFIYEGTDPQYAPLGRALSEMVVTDLATIDRVRVLERVRIQLLLDELQLSESGRVDPASAVRGGRILGAGQVIQGRVGGDEDEIRILAGIVPARVGAGVSAVEDADGLQSFFDLQKRLVLAFFEGLRIQLTPAERERVLQRPTESLQAILLFGRALEAEDRGDFREAARLFGQAFQLDPGFDEADRRAVDAERLGEQATVTPRGFTGIAMTRIPTAPGVPQSVDQIRIMLAEIDALIPGPELRDPGPELLGTEGVGLGPALLEILLRWP